MPSNKSEICMVLRSLSVLLAAAAALVGQTKPVLTRSANNYRTGVYQETVITPANVNRLHRVYSIPIPGDKRGVESQALVLPKVATAGGTYDLLVLSTMANDLLGCDLKTGKVLWKTNLGPPINGGKNIDFWTINDHWGVLSTGVIDPDTSTWYGVVWSSPDGVPTHGWHSLHAVDLKTGKETKPPLSMNPLTYNPGYGFAPVHFSGQMRKQRSALLLQSIAGRKVIAVPSGSVLETAQGASGWVAIADIAAWRFTASWSASISTYGGGIWMAGQGLAADEDGFLYALTGNGGFDGTTEFSESFVKLKYVPPVDAKKDMGALDIVDWWSPYSDAGRVGQDPQQIAIQKIFVPEVQGKMAGTNAADTVLKDEAVNHGHNHHDMKAMALASAKRWASWNDQDLGSGSISLIPDFNMIGGAGKDGIWYSVNKDHMGKTMPSDFANPARNYAKLLAPPVWFTFAAFKHDAKGNVIGYEDPAPQEVTKLDFAYDGKTHHMHSTPVVYQSATNGKILYCWGENGNLRAWRVNPNGSLTFLANGSETASPWVPQAPGGMPGGMMALSANGSQNAILWALVPMGDANRAITPGKLYAYDAQNFGTYSDGAGQIKLLWTSTVDFSHPKFNLPVITGGYVIVPTYDGRVDVYSVN
jgi:hypothetical protein